MKMLGKMADKEDSWLWIGVIAAAAAIIVFFGWRYLQGIKAAGIGGGAYYSNDSIDALMQVSFNVCAGVALDPMMVKDKFMAYDQHMRTRHQKDMQECLAYAEKFQNTQDPYWKKQYDTKITSICVHTLDNIQVPRRHGTGLGGGGGTGNLIPATSDVFTDVGPSTPATTVASAAGFTVRPV